MTHDIYTTFSKKPRSINHKLEFYAVLKVLHNNDLSFVHKPKPVQNVEKKKNDKDW